MQEAGKMPLFPLLGSPVITAPLLLLAKFGRVDTPATMHAPTRNQLMQHLVIHDVFDHIARDKSLIEESMNAD
jgi:hypothetical protein